jgi:hypothetical protein
MSALERAQPSRCRNHFDKAIATARILSESTIYRLITLRLRSRDLLA